MQPKLSILLPVIRVDRFLPVAIESIKDQTFSDYICYILTGELNDSEDYELKCLVASDARFVIHKLSLGGIAFALNYGLNLTKTKYVARMDGDDISHPNRFERQIDFLERNPSYAVVGCRVELINEFGNVIKHEFKFYERDAEIKQALKYRMPLCHPALMFRTDVMFENRGYMYGNNAEDHELYLRIARNKGHLMGNLPENLFSYRRHNNQLTDIKYAKETYCNIAGFLFTEFLRTYDVMYFVGIIANHEIFRKIRTTMRKLRGI